MIQAGNADDKLLIDVTAGNVRNNHISIAGHYSFFPRDVLGKARRSPGGTGKPIFIHLTGLDKTVETDIGSEARTGKPRRQFRGRKWVREFFRYHQVQPGDQLELQQTGDRQYRLSMAKRNGSVGPFRVAEFFAGIGLVRLALERHGFKVVFANDIDPDKQEMYQANFPADEFVLGDIHALTLGAMPTPAVLAWACLDVA